MTLDAFLASLTKPFWLDDPLFKTSDPPVSVDLTAADVDFVLAETRRSLERNRVGRAVNWLALGIRFRGDTYVPLVRRSGLLRPSKYGFRVSTIQPVVAALLARAEQLQLSHRSGRYLQSIAALATISPGALQRSQAILSFLRTHRHVALKGLLAMVDFAFMHETPADKSTDTDDIAFYTKEDLAEGFSLIVNMFSDAFGLLDRDIAILDAKAVASEEYAPVLVDACIIRKFVEWEVLIDVLDYEVTTEPGESNFILKSPDTNLAKSLRLGYIQTDMQTYVHHSEIKGRGLLPMRRVGENFYEDVKARWVEYVAEPVPRYRYHVPLVPEFLQLFAQDAFFLDEMLLLSAAAKDNLAEMDDILAFTLFEDVSVLELLKIQRFFNFLRSYAAAHLKEILPRQRALVFESLVPRFEIAQLLDVLGYIIPKEKAEKVLRLLNWKPGQGKVFDLQYQPVFLLEDVATIPSNVLASSNIIRNSLQIVRERIHASSSSDPITGLLDDAVKEAGWKSHVNRKYSFRGVSGEIDVLAVTESLLFAFECKNSLHPCNMHEIRTSVDHLRRAEEQLSRFASFWENPEFRSYLGRLIECPLTKETVLLTCIVTGNRMFTGYRMGEHPVRSVYELTAFLAEGTVKIGDQIRCFWKGSHVSAEDLVAYLKESLHVPQLEAMQPIRHGYQFGDVGIDEEVFVLDVLEAAKNLGFDTASLAASIDTPSV
jgi:hypothetical protein